MSTRDRYALFASLEASGSSPVYEEWATGLSMDEAMIELIDRELPCDKRQPNLLFAAARYLGLAQCPYPDFRTWLLRNWPAVQALAQTRSTQTNEVGRAAVIMPVLAEIDGPISLIEVGAAAGLCLSLDRFSYYYSGHDPIHPVDGPSTVSIECTISGSVPLPPAIPEVVYRAGLDLNPLNVENADDRRWLEALVWPGQDRRLGRLRAAIDVSRQSRPSMVSGDLNASIEQMVHEAPKNTTVVVFHSAVLSYISAADRGKFITNVQQLPCRWISNESPRYVEWPTIDSERQRNPETAEFVAALDGIPKAFSSPHGDWLQWLPAIA